MNTVQILPHPSLGLLNPPSCLTVRARGMRIWEQNDCVMAVESTFWRVKLLENLFPNYYIPAQPLIDHNVYQPTCSAHVGASVIWPCMCTSYMYIRMYFHSPKLKYTGTVQWFLLWKTPHTVVGA